MDKFLSDKRLLVFIGTVLAAVGGWGIGFGDWSEMTTPNAIFGLLMILGSMLGANVTSNVLKTPPTIIETTEPKTVVKTTITTPNEKQ